MLVSPTLKNNGEPLERQHIDDDLNGRQVLLQIARDKGIPFIALMASMTATKLDRAPDAAARLVVLGHFASRLETTWTSRVGPASRWIGSRGTAAVRSSPGHFG